MQTFYSHGKLLISAEYAVLDGALALALPTKFGQFLSVETTSENTILWKSISNEGPVWFEAKFTIDAALKISTADTSDVAVRLVQVLEALQQLNPLLFEAQQGYALTSTLEFPENWGLGSSSTLINNLAQWAQVDAFELLALTFGGSGFDIACAQHDSGILYQLNEGKPTVKLVHFSPPFSDALFFVHRNQKQNSRDGIASYKKLTANQSLDFSELNSLTLDLLNCTDLKTFESLLEQHERYISTLIQQPPLKEVLFSDYKGAIKSLGAWGGDFFLATGNATAMDYFKSKGFTTVVGYSEMIF
ncbi:GYDIA family GHMP kinase [Flavobacteriaceae bacterium]|nr:GYDIA family GHMP kinase [Flavobacteriaceae bacterium]